MLKIGQRLKQERLRLKLSQSALGTLGGVETNAQGNYESGARYPRADYLSRIAAAGVDVAYIVTGLRLHPVCPAVPAPGETWNADEQQNEYQTDAMGSLIERLQANLHGITADLYQITRLADNRADSAARTTQQTQLDDIKGEAEAIALATMKLIFVTSRLN